MKTRSDGLIDMTESKMTLPAASVTALVFAHPQAKYFAVGQVNKDQEKGEGKGGKKERRKAVKEGGAAH